MSPANWSSFLPRSTDLNAPREAIREAIGKGRGGQRLLVPAQWTHLNATAASVDTRPMIASAAKPDSSASNPVDWILDEIGRALPPWVFRALLGVKSSEALCGAPVASDLFGFGLRFVLDSCSLQRALRQQLKYGKSGLLEAMRSGFIRPIAPKQLDKEIRRHLREIAADTGAPLRTARALYREIAEQIEFKTVRSTSVKRAKREMSNGEDAAFVALLRDSNALGVITEEKAFASIPGLRVYSGASASGIVLTFRKQATVFACVVPLAKAVWQLVSSAFRVLAAFVRQFPRIAAGLALALLGLAAAYPEKAAKLLDAARVAWGDLWARAWPHLVGLATTAHDRFLAANQARQQLGVGGPGAAPAI